MKAPLLRRILHIAFIRLADQFPCQYLTIDMYYTSKVEVCPPASGFFACCFLSFEISENAKWCFRVWRAKTRWALQYIDCETLFCREVVEDGAQSDSSSAVLVDLALSVSASVNLRQMSCIFSFPRNSAVFQQVKCERNSLSVKFVFNLYWTQMRAS